MSPAQIRLARYRKIAAENAEKAARYPEGSAPNYLKTDWRDVQREDWQRPFRKRGTNPPYTTNGRDRLQWMEPGDLDGLRHEGLTHEIIGGRHHTGWYCDDYISGETTSGTVYRLPAKRGRSRFIYGRTDECNEGAACIALELIEADDRDDHDAKRDAARYGDSMAETWAEESREHSRAWRNGQDAAQADRVAKTTAAELRALLAEVKQERRAGMADRPAICAALRSNVRSLWDDLHAYRKTRDELRDAAPTYDADLMATWRDGFASI